MKKTNSTRILDFNSINYELVVYDVDESDLSATTRAKKKREGLVTGYLYRKALALIIIKRINETTH